MRIDLKKLVIIFSVLILFDVAAYFGYNFLHEKLFSSKPNNDVKENNNATKEENKDQEGKQEETKEPEVIKPKLKIIDLDSKTRPIAIMIDNESGAWPQAGLQDAFLVYEIIVEGGATRFLAIFKDKSTTMIGPIRSARHYFLDYALESDAIYTHFGYSPQALNDIKLLGVNNISGTQADGGAFWREKPLGSYHNVFTSIANLTSKASSKGYRLTSDATPVLNYSVDEVDLSSGNGAIVANSISIRYSSSHTVSYEYDQTTRVYKRFMRGNPHVDRITGAQYEVKNIIICTVRNYPLNDGSGKGRQGLDNIGTGDGYYISDGYAIPIKWEKTSRDSKTIYRDYNGNEIKINDGNTFIQIQPYSQTLTIK